MAIPERKRREHLLHNKEWWEREGKKRALGEGGFIENQSQLDNITYGLHNTFLSSLFLKKRPLCGKENSCEIIAVYNALLEMSSDAEGKERISFPELLAVFEKKGIWLKGYFGTKPGAVISFFKERHYKTTVLRNRRITPVNIKNLESHEVFILMGMNNRNKLWDMIHTICITRTEKGYICHNVFSGTGEYDSLENAVAGFGSGRGRALILMGISKG